MHIKNTEKEYGTISKTLHWLVLIIFIVLIAIASKLGDLPEGPGKAGTGCPARLVRPAALFRTDGALTLALAERHSREDAAYPHLAARPVKGSPLRAVSPAVCTGYQWDGPICHGRIQGAFFRIVRSAFSNGQRRSHE